MEYKFHPFADVFPLLIGYDIDKLTEDIEENGQREPIILYDGKILDGRNRYRACIDLGIEPHFAQSTATNDEQALRESVSRNLRRRHLSPSQRSMVAADLLPMFEAMAKDRQGERTDIPANLPECSKETGEARERAAEVAQSSARSVQSAKNVKTDGVAELVSAVRDGDIAVSRAEEVSKLDEDMQREVVARVKEGEKASKVVREVKQRDLILDGRYRLPSAQHCQDVADIQTAEKRARSTKNQNSSNSVEWYTPSEYIECARELMGGIDLDPASCELANETVKADTYYTKDDDGFTKAWSGRVWMNPPYGREGGESVAGLWAERLIDSYENGEVTNAVFLVNAATGAKWFQSFWEYSICFVHGRINFYKPNDSLDDDANKLTKDKHPTKYSAIIYLGDDIHEFKTAFRPHGRLVIGGGVCAAKTWHFYDGR